MVIRAVTSYMVRVLAALLLMQLPANVPGRAAEDDLSA